MGNQLQNNMNSGNSYLQLFHKAQDNFTQVCEEYKATRLCKKNRHKQNNKTNNLLN
jgi:hypothetical protein